VPKPFLDGGEAHRRALLRGDGFFPIGAIEQVESADHLFRLGKWPVDQGAFLALIADAQPLALGLRPEPSSSTPALASASW
jgi:hypothetical protein